jgi:molybdenum cofactor cytidylyltransferase
VVLAAGVSSRLGTPKQLLVYRGQPLLAVVVQSLLASPVDEVIVVLGHMADQAAKALQGLPVKVVINSDYAGGLSSSVKAGLAAVSDSVRAVLFVLGDQPLVKPETIRILIRQYEICGGIVAPRFRDRRGNPVLFDRRLLLSGVEFLEGDAGGRAIIERYPESLHQVDVPDEGVLLDIDTWEDYRRLVENHG